jgi:hypothetical protein
MVVIRSLGVGLRRLAVGVALVIAASVVVLVALAARVVLALGVLLLLVLAAVALAAAIFELDGGHGSVSLAHLASLIHLPALRHDVGVYLRRLEAPGPVAWVSIGAGAAAIAVGLLLLAGVFVPRRDRLIALADGALGPVLARRRALARVAAALAEQPRGVTRARARARARRGGHGGTLRVRAVREPQRARDQTEQEITGRLATLAEPFELTARIDARRTADAARRVQ